MKISKQLHWLIYPIFLLACAQTTSPTGGPKDTIPPNLEGSLPVRGQTNFKASEIQLTFDEAIVLNNAKDQILITPDIDKKYEITAKRNKVLITLETKLQDSTTYSINFRESIQDITEKNPAENLKIAFSTGSYIDSLSIAGKVFDVAKSTEIKDATIALYNTDTFNIFKHRPSYITKSNDKGEFRLEYIKNGNYKIYAFEDKNRNLIVDSKTENYGYSSDTIHLDDNKTKLDIGLIRLDTRPIKITSARPYNTYFNIKFSKGLKNVNIESDQTAPIYSILTPDKAVLKIYKQNLNTDSTKIKLTAVDSIGLKIDTTFYVKFLEKESTKEKAEWKIEKTKVVLNKGLIKAEIVFNKPLYRINYDSINYQLDSTSIISFNKNDLVYDTVNHKIIINKSADRNLFFKKPEIPNKTTPALPATTPKSKSKQSEHILKIGKGAFETIENDSIEHQEIKMKPLKIDDTGVIMFTVNTNHEHFIAELLNKNYQVIDKKRNEKKLVFEDLEPGDYLLRIIIDTDNNGQWSPGNFFLNQPPEKIIYYQNDKKQQITNLKANWELGPLLINL